MLKMCLNRVLNPIPSQILSRSSTKKCKDDIPEASDFQNNLPDLDKCIAENFTDHPRKIEEYKQAISRGKESMPTPTQIPSEKNLLRQFLKERFEEKVYGTGPRRRAVDHTIFFELYQSQLSKMVTLAINSYCMYADVPDPWNEQSPGVTFFNLVTELESPQGLSQSQQSLNEQKKREAFKRNQKLLNDSAKAAKFMSICYSGISKVCHAAKDDPAIKDYSRKQACLVLSTLRQFNRALTINEKTINYLRCRGEFARREQCQNGATGFQLGLEFYDPSLSGQTIDDITSLTSTEFNKNVIKKMEQICPQSDPNPSPECLEQLNVTNSDTNQLTEQKEKDQKTLAEFHIQTRIVDSVIKQYESADIAAEITAEGAEISNIIQDIENKSELEIKALRQEIATRYNTEREAILKNLAHRMTSNSAYANADNRAIIQSIREKNTQQNNSLAQLLFFNNIITGYLEVKDVPDPRAVPPNQNHAQSNVRRNLDSARRELELAKLDPGQDLPFDLGKQSIESLNDRLDELAQQQSPNARGPTAANPTFSPGQIYIDILGDKDAYDKVVPPTPNSQP